MVDQPPPTGFWGRVETRVAAFLADRARVARAFQIAYWVSMAMVIVGAIVVGWHYMGGGP